MLLWIDGDAPRSGMIWRVSRELGLTQNVRAGMAFMAVNVANGDGMGEEQFLPAIGAFTSEQLLGPAQCNELTTRAAAF